MTIKKKSLSLCLLGKRKAEDRRTSRAAFSTWEEGKLIRSLARYQIILSWDTEPVMGREFYRVRIPMIKNELKRRAEGRPYVAK